MSYLGNSPINGRFQKIDTIAGSFNGSTTTFACFVGGTSAILGAASNLIISLNGVIQEPFIDYTVSGNSNIIFSVAPTTSATFFGIILGIVGTSTNVDVNTLTGTLGVLSGGTGGTSLKTIGAQSIVGSGDISGLNLNIVSGTSVTAVAGNHYVLTNVATTTVTMPTTGLSGDTVIWITPRNDLYTNVVDFGSLTVRGPGGSVTGALTLDQRAPLQVRYIDGTVNWIIL